jgi:hypothetical protein
MQVLLLRVDGIYTHEKRWWTATYQTLRPKKDSVTGMKGLKLLATLRWS